MLNSSLVQLLPHADQIVVLDEDGRVAQKGSFDSLSSSEGYVGGLGLKRAGIEKAAAADAEEVEQELQVRRLCGLVFGPIGFGLYFALICLQLREESNENVGIDLRKVI